jgi:muramidase (phage lysozyme)
MANELLEMIGNIESSKGYNAEFGDKDLALDQMTISEVLDHQVRRRNEGAKSSAVGRYQFIHSTLKDLVDKNPNDLPPDALFNEEQQDKAASILLKRRGMDDYANGDIDEHQFAKNLSKEWASLPNPDTGSSYYDGDGLNKSLTSTDTVFETLRRSKTASAVTDAAQVMLDRQTQERQRGDLL